MNAATWSALLLLAVVPVSATTSGCTDECGNVNCGSGVHVWWAPGDMPDDAKFRLCVDDVCEKVLPARIGSGGEYREVAPHNAVGLQRVRVRLELLDATGQSLKTLEGEGKKTGRCCPSIELRATPVGTLVVDHMFSEDDG